MRLRRRSRIRRRIAMGTEILDVSDRLLAAVMNGIYQGILITALVALGVRVFRRINAATRHALWLCTLVLLILLVVAHCWFDSPPPALGPGKIARTEATPGQEIGTSYLAAAAATSHGMPTEAGSAVPKLPGDLPAEQDQPASPKPDSLPLTSTEPRYEPVLKMGGAGDSPASVGDPPTGTSAGKVAKKPRPLARTVAPAPSGESPEGTGGSPV